MESKVQNSIKKYLENLGWFVVKVITCSKNGFPDLLAFRNGYALVCEVKQKGQKPRKLQEYRLNELEGYGVISLWADSLETFKTKYDKRIETTK